MAKRPERLLRPRNMSVPASRPTPYGGGTVTVHPFASGSGAGQHTLNRGRPSPSLEEPERVSHHRGRAQGIRPLGALAFTDAVRSWVQRALSRLIPLLSREASGSPAPLL
jgi:hypothetical protein